MNYETRLEAFETAYKEIVETACRYYAEYAASQESADLKQATAVIATAIQMARAFRVDYEIRQECFAML